LSFKIQDFLTDHLALKQILWNLRKTALKSLNHFSSCLIETINFMSLCLYDIVLVLIFKIQDFLTNFWYYYYHYCRYPVNILLQNQYLVLLISRKPAVSITSWWSEGMWQRERQTKLTFDTLSPFSRTSKEENCVTYYQFRYYSQKIKSHIVNII
jgi:hypothetical protein